MASVETSFVRALKCEFQKVTEALIASGVPGSELIARLHVVLGQNCCVCKNLEDLLDELIKRVPRKNERRVWCLVEKVPYDTLLARIEWHSMR